MVLATSLSAHPAAALYEDGLATIDEHGVDRFAVMGESIQRSTIVRPVVPAH